MAIHHSATGWIGVQAEQRDFGAIEWGRDLTDKFEVIRAEYRNRPAIGGKNGARPY